MMKFNFFLIQCSVLFTFFSSTLGAQSFAVEIDSVEVQTGQEICLKVHALGFDDIISYQYTLEWNPLVLTYLRTQNYGLPDLSAIDFNEFPDDVLATAWASSTGLGVNRVNGAVIYEVCFTVVGGLGSSTAITIGGNFPPSSGLAEAYNFDNQNVWTPALNVTGFVAVTQAVSTSEASKKGKTLFQVNPNPTSASAQIKLNSSIEGVAQVWVSNALGQVVSKQEITVQTGENSFEIPAKALNTKGIYQVSVQTDKGISSQMLSVQ